MTKGVPLIFSSPLPGPTITVHTSTRHACSQSNLQWTEKELLWRALSVIPDSISAEEYFPEIKWDSESTSVLTVSTRQWEVRTGLLLSMNPDAVRNNCLDALILHFYAEYHILEIMNPFPPYSYIFRCI